MRIAGPQRNIIQTYIYRRIRQVTPLANREKDAFDFLVESHPKIDVRKPMFNALAKAGYPLLMVRPHDMSLEDIFISLTENEPAHDDLKGV